MKRGDYVRISYINHKVNYINDRINYINYINHKALNSSSILSILDGYVISNLSIGGIPISVLFSHKKYLSLRKGNVYNIYSPLGKNISLISYEDIIDYAYIKHIIIEKVIKFSIQ